MAVAIVNSDIDATVTGVTAPGAGSSRITYGFVASQNSTNGQYLATDLDIGGQTGTSVTSIKPASPFREGIGIAIFRFTEAQIALMVNGNFTPTWGDASGEPDGPFFGQITFSGADQSSPNGTPVTNAHDTLAGSDTWDPGDISGVADGFIFSVLAIGGNPTTATFTNLTETLDLAVTGLRVLGGTTATVNSSAIDCVTALSGTQRPECFAGFVVNPLASGQDHTIEVYTGPWR